MVHLTATAPKSAARRRAEAANRKQGNYALLSPYTVLVDQQEKTPWTFEGIESDAKQRYKPLVVQTEVYHLRTGDYSVAGMEDRLTIERKSLPDLLGSITRGHARFEREHQRMAELLQGPGPRVCVVVVEGALSQIEDLRESEVPAKVARRTWLSWREKYGVEWLWAGDRRNAELLAHDLLSRAWKAWQTWKEELW